MVGFTSDLSDALRRFPPPSPDEPSAPPALAPRASLGLDCGIGSGDFVVSGSSGTSRFVGSFGSSSLISSFTSVSSGSGFGSLSFCRYNEVVKWRETHIDAGGGVSRRRYRGTGEMSDWEHLNEAEAFEDAHLGADRDVWRRAARHGRL